MSVYQYTVKGADGKEYGPVDLATLQEWVRQGRVSNDTKVRNLGNGMLLQASNMPELDGFFAVIHPRQSAAMASGLVYASADQKPEYWDDYKFVLAMSLIGLFLSLAIGWLAVIFCLFGMARAWSAARDQKPMSGLAFAVSVACTLGAIALPFLVGFWFFNVFFGSHGSR